MATDALWSRAWVDESALPKLREGQPVRVQLSGDEQSSLVGTVDRIAREVDRQTHELLVDVLLSAVPARVAIGQRADVWIEIERRKNVVRAPMSFVHRQGDRAFRYVDRGGRIRNVPITLGALGNDDVEVTANLQPDDVLLDALEVGGQVPLGRRWRKAVR